METIPLHESKQLAKKETSANEMLNYSLNSSTRAINKIPKGQYGYIEEYDLIKAEKFLSKRRTNVTYDPNIVYGKATNSNSTATGINNQKRLSQNNIHQEIKEEKEEDAITDNDNDNDNNNNSDDDIDNDKQYPKEKTIGKVKVKNKPKPPLSRKKKQIERKDPTINKAEEPSSQNEYDHTTIEYNKTVPTSVVNPQNKNFLLLFDNNPSAKAATKYKTNEDHEHEHDIYSCNNCEPVYVMCIMNNEPLKVLKCLICNNLINKTSLEFYLNKYKDQILSNQNKGKVIKTKDKPKQQQNRPKEDKSTNESGITEHWGMLIESNKARIKEQLIYDIVDGKTKLTAQQKDMTLNKIKNTPLEEIVKRKAGKDLHSKSQQKQGESTK